MLKIRNYANLQNVRCNAERTHCIFSFYRISTPIQAFLAPRVTIIYEFPGKQYLPQLRLASNDAKAEFALGVF